MASIDETPTERDLERNPLEWELRQVHGDKVINHLFEYKTTLDNPEQVMRLTLKLGPEKTEAILKHPEVSAENVGLLRDLADYHPSKNSEVVASFLQRHLAHEKDPMNAARIAKAKRHLKNTVYDASHLKQFRLAPKPKARK